MPAPHPSIPESALHPTLRSPLWKERPTGWICRCGAAEFEPHEEFCVPTVPWFEYVFDERFLEFMAATPTTPPYYIPRKHYTIETFVQDGSYKVPDVCGRVLCNERALDMDVQCYQTRGHELPHLGVSGELEHHLMKLGLNLWYRVYINNVHINNVHINNVHINNVHFKTSFFFNTHDLSLERLMRDFPGSTLLDKNNLEGGD